MTTPPPPDDPASWHPAHARAADYAGRSNLALAFLSLPKDKRADMNVFYTFCRLVDDIADSDTLPPDEKSRLLAAWWEVLGDPDPTIPTGPDLRLTHQLAALIEKYRLPVAHFHEIIAGMEMDIYSRQYATFEQLRAYCYRVASVVGLVSIEIFGYRDESCRLYAVDLGLALQLTNIIRDVGVDLDNGGRIYLPLEDLERFGYTPGDLRARVYDKRFRALMDFEAQRAREYFRKAAEELSPRDRRAMVAAEIMRGVYWQIWKKFVGAATRFSMSGTASASRANCGPCCSRPCARDGRSVVVFLVRGRAGCLTSRPPGPNWGLMHNRFARFIVTLGCVAVTCVGLTSCDTPAGQGAGIGAATGAVIGGLATGRVRYAAAGRRRARWQVLWSVWRWNIKMPGPTARLRRAVTPLPRPRIAGESWSARTRPTIRSTSRVRAGAT